jgi:hypothetical protein
MYSQASPALGLLSSPLLPTLQYDMHAEDLPARRELFCVSALHSGNHQEHEACELFRCEQWEWRCAVNVECTLSFKDSTNQESYLPNNTFNTNNMEIILLPFYAVKHIQILILCNF